MAQGPFKKIFGFFKRLFGPTHPPELDPRREREDEPTLPPIAPKNEPGVIRPRPSNRPPDPAPGEELPPITPRPDPVPGGPTIRPRPRPENPTPPPTPTPPSPPVTNPTPPPVSRPTEPLPQREFTPVTSLLAEARQYIATPYRFGGTDPATGFDCSGFLDYVFTRKGFELPRTSREQAKAGREVPKEKARPGDLVYFTHDGDTVQHIGMVISEPGEELAMIHASSSQGVIETNVDSSSYWSPRMLGVRRVIG